MIKIAQRLGAGFAMLLALVGVGVSPAQATTAVGSWWTNSSQCDYAGGGRITSQARYTNFVSGVLKTDVDRFAVSVSGVGTITKFDLELWQGTDLLESKTVTPAAGQTSINVAVALNDFVNDYPGDAFPAGGQLVYRSYTTQKPGGCGGQFNVGAA